MEQMRESLKVPVWQIPYLEKHRIYELFHELARELVIQKPLDHVLFIKQILLNATTSKDAARVIFLNTPKVNCLDVALQMSKITKQIVITERILLDTIGNDDRKAIRPTVIAKYLACLVRTEKAYKYGWIMVDCIETAAEAKALLRLGILPTHVLHLITPFYPNLDELLYCNVPVNWPEYRQRITAIRNVFQTKFIEIHCSNRVLTEVVNECVSVTKIRPGPNLVKPRIVLLGPRGSGRKTQAKLLSESLKLVHINFEDLLCQLWISECEMGEKLRNCNNEVCYHSQLLTQMINKRILEDDCVRNGWVLTGFPFTETDFKFIDSLDTPPNRVIFLECDLGVCKQRVCSRRTNCCTGEMSQLHHKDANPNLKIHPKDKKAYVEAELAFYCEHYESMRKYCGCTAFYINADQSERHVFECVTAAVAKAPTACDPRRGLADIKLAPQKVGATLCECVSLISTVLNACHVKL